jgi:hypothetical protein
MTKILPCPFCGDSACVHVKHPKIGKTTRIEREKLRAELEKRRNPAYIVEELDRLRAEVAELNGVVAWQKLAIEERDKKIDSLNVEVEKWKASAMREHDGFADCLALLQAERDKNKVVLLQVGELKKALLQYGLHSYRCQLDGRPAPDDPSEGVCTCGFSKYAQ